MKLQLGRQQPILGRLDARSAFENEAEAQAGKKISPQLNAKLIADAEAIEVPIDCKSGRETEHTDKHQDDLLKNSHTE
jgi:hypothetical protein